MYDLYSIPDGVETPPHPPEDSYLGSLTLEEHKALEPFWTHLNRCGFYLDYFSDARILSHKVAVARQLISQALRSNHARINTRAEGVERKLENILSMAEQLGVGIVGFAD